MTPQEVTFQAKGMARRVSDHLSDQANRLRDSAADTRYHAEDYILQNPWQAIAITAAVSGLIGLTVGLFISRR